MKNDLSLFKPQKLYFWQEPANHVFAQMAKNHNISNVFARYHLIISLYYGYDKIANQVLRAIAVYAVLRREQFSAQQSAAMIPPLMEKI